MSTTFGIVNEDGSFSVLGRVCSLDGTGVEVVRGEGNCLKQADVNSITCKVFDLGTDPDNLTGTPVPPDPTVLVSSAIRDSLQRVGWKEDLWGWNFRHDVDPSYVPTGGNWYLIEYKLTPVSGGPMWRRVKVKALGEQTS